MQANFEARFNTYLSLTSDQANSCNFLTILFKRVVHFFREKEWVTDLVILEKFKASIQEPSEKTKEIYQVFLDRIGQNPILDIIKDKIVASREKVKDKPIIIEPVNPVQSLIEKPRPMMKMTHSRLHPELWYYARQTRMFGNYNLEILLTKEGEKLSDKDKEALKTHLKNSQDHNTLEYRQILLSWMLDVEKEERNEFKIFLQSVVDRISKGESQEQLKHDLRKIRKYLMNRDPLFFNNSGKAKAGNSSYVFQPLLDVLFPGKFKNNYRCFDRDKYTVKNGRIYIPKRLSPREFDDKPHWAAGFVIGHNEHATTYIYDGSHYVWLDHDRKPNKVTAQELYEKILSIHLGSSFDYMLIPDSAEPTSFPNASEWVVPGWERNNCFIASSLTLLAAVNFYEKRPSNSTSTIKMIRSRFVAKFLERLKESGANFWNPQEKYLTEEGKNLSEADKNAINEGLAYCHPLSAFRNYLEGINPSLLDDAAINEFNSFFNSISGGELNAAEKDVLNLLLIKYSPFPSPPKFDIDKSQLSKIKEKLNSPQTDNLSLYSLFNSCIIHEILKVKGNLLSLVEEIEKEETIRFKRFLELFLDRIINGDSTEELKMDLREIREYLINHGRFEPGEYNTGRDSDVFYPLIKILFPERDEPINPYYRNQISLKNNRIYVSKQMGPGKSDANLAAGILISTNNHYTIAIFNGSHYVWIDQFKAIQIRTPDLMFLEIGKLSPETSFNFFLIPEGIEIKEQPDPSKWTIPGWERNNCFIAASLVLIALLRFHRKNDKNL